MNGIGLLSLGFLAQGLFSARFIIQLIRSEKAGKVLSPLIFWQLSILASFLLMVYGTFRHDIVIVGGQVFGYFIYIRNLQLQNAWDKFPKWSRVLILIMPFVFFGFLFSGDFSFPSLFSNPEIGTLLLTWGSIGQVLFTGRFFAQWYFAEQKKESHFPISFWYISIVGAVIIASYAIFRKDAVLFIGQAFGVLVYARNISIEKNLKFSIPSAFLDQIKSYRLPVLIGFTAFVLFFNIQSWSVTESSEARYAEIGKEMLESGDWIHPQLMGIYHYHKPPMTYWITAVAYKLFGVSPFSARFFLQIAVLFQIFLVYRLGLLLFQDSKKAFLAAMLYSSFSVVIIGSRALTTDTYLATFILVAIFFWFSHQKSKKPISLIASFVFLGLGFLTKGPVVWIVPIVLKVYQAYQKRAWPKFNWPTLLGLVLMLGIGLFWFVGLYIEDARFLDYFLFKHTIQRFATDTFSRGQPFWFYPVVLIVTAFPWFLILLQKSVWVAKNKSTQLALFWVWVVIPVLFFSISQSKLVLYILPVYSGLAFGSILAWDQLSDRAQKKWEITQFIFFGLVLIGLIISPKIDPRITLGYKFYYIWFILIGTLVGLLISGIQRKDRVLINAWVFTMGVGLMASYFFSANPAVVNDTRRVAAWISENHIPDDEIFIYDKRLPSISFQSELPIVSIYDGDESLNRETQFQKDESWKETLINLKTDPDWINQAVNQKGFWISKSSKKLPDLPTDFSWKLQVEIDGWKIHRIEPKK
ncbi:MAG: lipid-A-disaccharide synthase N-terminal domain-containing protein [Algoriphagus sp.]|uniref:lipid-A-disaccharide synthase N-terminal domain-containing protein n=1 Tax=Algoriphagus sp. TaxID=1872435 RepID=UPI00261CCC29|nr:lipid-A-disaccharide synthase N-terminal domain-containing protein [Algoriphagus sp.]MDG1277791.1 lipid-A-disaccharide synthase N-terminal domain-containing protein [Algoriphagus sp.]